jgi:hypothetical protein
MEPTNRLHFSITPDHPAARAMLIYVSKCLAKDCFAKDLKQIPNDFRMTPNGSNKSNMIPTRFLNESQATEHEFKRDFRRIANPL